MNLEVKPGDSMADVLSAVQKTEDADLTLQILDEASLFLTANEFRALSLAADRSGVSLTIESLDPLRRQLAAMFKIPVAESAEIDHPGHGDIEALEGGFESTLLKVDEPERGKSSDEQPPEERAGAEESVPVQDADLDDETDDDSGADRRSNVPWGRIALGALAFTVALAVGLFGYWWFFSTATVDLQLARTPVETNLEFVVANNGAADVIQTQGVSFNVSVPVTAPATGVESVGETAATGELVLRNPTIEDIEIPAGMAFIAFNGVEFTFPADVTVPAVLPDGSAGETTAEIQSVELGSAGNADVGMLTGQLENGAYYSNRLVAVDGGTDRETAVVTEEDIDQLEATAFDTLQQMAVTSELSGGLRVVPSSLTISESSVTFDQEPGDEATQITAEASATFEASAYQAEALNSAAAEALAAQVPDGNVLMEDSIRFGVPVETGSGEGTMTLFVPVAGTYIPVLTAEQQQAMLAGIQGESEDDAIGLLESFEIVDDASMSFSPSWMPHRVPDSSDRIDLETS